MSHADDPLGDRKDLRHGVTLAAVIVVFVQLIHDQAVYLSLVPALDIGAHGVSAAGSNGGEMTVRGVCDLLEPFQYGLVFGFAEVLRGPVPVHPAVASDLHPAAFLSGIDRLPKRGAAVVALVVFAVFRPEEELVHLSDVPHAIL